MFQKNSSGATIRMISYALAPTGHSLKENRADPPHLGILGIKYHKIAQLSTTLLHFHHPNLRHIQLRLGHDNIRDQSHILIL